MRRDICNFAKEMCAKHNLRCTYVPDAHDLNDVWTFLTKSGIPIMSFTTRIYYSIPMRARKTMFLPSIKRGLNHVLGERQYRETGQLYQHRRMGRVIA